MLLKKTLKFKNKPGFTIVELLIVVVVIAILAAITTISYTGIQQRATAASLLSTVSSVSKGISLFKIENKKYPITIDDCPSPAATNTCLPTSSGLIYTYRVNSSTNPQEYSLVVSKGTQKAGVVNSRTASNAGADLLSISSLENTGPNEFLRYYNLASTIDSWGLRPYTISFDIKSANISNQSYVQVYAQNGNGAKYAFYATVPVTTSFVRQSVTVTPTNSSSTEVDAYLSFYGTYGTGNVSTVKNLRVELAN